MRRDRFAPGCSIKEIGEGVKEVAFPGLGRLKGKDLLWVVEEIDAIKRYSLMTN